MDSNTWHFKCSRHERWQALARLAGPDFEPLQLESGVWVPLDSIRTSLAEDLAGLLPELPILYPRLPYIFSQYKIHKQKHRWLTNAHDCIFSEAAVISQLCCQECLSIAQGLAGDTAASLKDNYGVSVQFFPSSRPCLMLF